MKANFNIAQLRQIAIKVRQYKKVFVTTEGQMFLTPETADEAVRTKNMILDDPNDYIGVLALTEDQVTDALLVKYVKDIEIFNEVFNKAVVPVSKNVNKKQFERKTEKVEATPQDITEAVDKAFDVLKSTPAAPAPAAPATSVTDKK